MKSRPQVEGHVQRAKKALRDGPASPSRPDRLEDQVRVLVKRSVLVSGGGGNRTRVLRCLNGTSPSAAGDRISGSPLATGTGGEPQSTKVSPPAR